MENIATTKYFDEIVQSFTTTKPPKGRKRQLMIGMDFIKGMRKSNGDKFTYDFLNNFEIMCDMDTYDYIIDFLKDFETDERPNPDS
jgi:hypothetical protein